MTVRRTGSSDRSSTLAGMAQTAMMLEVCAEVKPGNVDRKHDYDDTWLEHFLASAIFAGPVFDEAEVCDPDKGIGELIYDAVWATNSHSGGNTHFGAFILLIPLIKGRGIPGAFECVKQTTVDDAVFFYKAFGLTAVRMNESDDEIDVNDPESIRQLREKGMTLYDVMEYSSVCDMVAGEWINGFSLTRKAADLIKEFGHGRAAIGPAFLELLATENDTFVAKKHGAEVADQTREMAAGVLSGLRAKTASLSDSGNINADKSVSVNDVLSPEDFDIYCLDKGINPGSVADIVIAGIFVALMEGWRWDCSAAE